MREETLGEPVGTVIMHNVVSADGFIADRNDDVGPLHDWYFSGDTPITDGGGQQYDHSGTGSGFKVSRASAEYVRPMWEAPPSRRLSGIAGQQARRQRRDGVGAVHPGQRPGHGCHPVAQARRSDDLRLSPESQELSLSMHQ
jgi:hypothetical protein